MFIGHASAMSVSRVPLVLALFLTTSCSSGSTVVPPPVDSGTANNSDGANSDGGRDASTSPLDAPPAVSDSSVTGDRGATADTTQPRTDASSTRDGGSDSAVSACTLTPYANGTLAITGASNTVHHISLGVASTGAVAATVGMVASRRVPIIAGFPLTGPADIHRIAVASAWPDIQPLHEPTSIAVASDGTTTSVFSVGPNPASQLVGFAGSVQSSATAVELNGVLATPAAGFDLLLIGRATAVGGGTLGGTTFPLRIVMTERRTQADPPWAQSFLLADMDVAGGSIYRGAEPRVVLPGVGDPPPVIDINGTQGEHVLVVPANPFTGPPFLWGPGTGTRLDMPEGALTDRVGRVSLAPAPSEDRYVLSFATSDALRVNVVDCHIAPCQWFGGHTYAGGAPSVTATASSGQLISTVFARGGALHVRFSRSSGTDPSRILDGDIYPGRELHTIPANRVGVDLAAVARVDGTAVVIYWALLLADSTSNLATDVVVGALRACPIP